MSAATGSQQGEDLPCILPPPPPGLELRSSLLPVSVWNKLRAWIVDFSAGGGVECSCSCSHRDESCCCDSSSVVPWELSAEGRRVAQWGFRYDYGKQKVDATRRVPGFPAWAYSILGVDAETFPQVILNEYRPEDYIPFHVDDAAFGPVVLVAVFGEARPVLFRPKLSDGHSVSTTNTSTLTTTHDTTSNPTTTVITAGTTATTSTTIALSVPHCGVYQMEGEARYEWQHSVGPGSGTRYSFTFRSLQAAEI